MVLPIVKVKIKNKTIYFGLFLVFLNFNHKTKFKRNLNRFELLQNANLIDKIN